MRIRLYAAYASNNSGSYTLVGNFADAITAAQVADLVERVCAEHAAWNDAAEEAGGAESPMARLVRDEGLRATAPPHGDDDWPQHGPRPRAVATGHQILIHAPYTASLTRAFGELIYARGGRVDTEIDHAHAPVAVELSYWPHLGDPDGKDKLAAFEAELLAALPDLCAPGPHDDRRPVAPVVYGGLWGERHCGFVLRELVAGMEAVRTIADLGEITLSLRVHECPYGFADPFAHLRAGPGGQAGRWQVILWSVGANRVAAMKAVRAARQCGLVEARDAVDQLPLEVVAQASEEYARACAEALRAAGCDAEAVLPAADR